MKKLLFVIHSLGFGGAERSLINLLHELPKDQYEVDLLLFQKKGAFLKQVPSWVRVLDTPKALDRLYGSVKTAGSYAAVKLFGSCFARLMRKTRKARRAYRWQHFYKACVEKLPTHYDTAVAYVGTEILYYVGDCVSADRKLVWIHNDYRTAGYSRDDDKPYLEVFDAIASVSDECVRVLKEEFPEYAAKTFYVENITSSARVRTQAEAFVPEDLRQDVCSILSIGRLSVQKGFDLAMEAAAILKQRGLSFCWYVIGTGDQKQQLEEKRRSLGIEDCFILLGTRDAPYPYIKNCTVFAQTSRFEGKSVVLDEAKILCAPIVTTAYPTAADQIAHGREGLVTGMTPEEIADGIEQMLAGDTRQTVCQYLAEHEYGNQKEIQKYLHLLDASL